MDQMCKELLTRCILESLDTDENLMDIRESQIFEDCIEIPYSVGDIITPEGIVDFGGKIIVFDDGYYMMSDIGETAAKRALPELVKFVELFNTNISHGDMCVDLESEFVFYRTCERFWDEHTFNADIFYEMINTHIDVHRYYKEQVKLLIKGASSAEKQIEKMKAQDVRQRDVSIDHLEVAARIKEWLSSIKWPYNVDEDNSELYLSLTSAQTKLSTNIQVRIFDDGSYRVFAIWPDDIEPDNDKLPEFVTRQAIKNYDYGRLRFSAEDGFLYYVSETNINDISELTDEILDKTITGSAVYMAETYGPEIAKLL